MSKTEKTLKQLKEEMGFAKPTVKLGEPKIQVSCFLPESMVRYILTKANGYGGSTADVIRKLVSEDMEKNNAN